MRRLTFSDVLNSTMPQNLGLCSQDRAKVAAYTNESMERLLMDALCPDEGWFGTYVFMLFNVTVTNHTAKIITPREVARIIALDICNRPRFIRNGFYEYQIFGTGAKPQLCGSNCCATQQAFERDNVVLLTDFPSSVPQFVRFFPSDNADVGKRVILSGLDQNGIQVLATDPVTGAASIGEVIILTLPFATSVNQYQEVQGILKDPTKGPVAIFAVDPVSLSQTQISSMETNETSASYREYLLDGLPTHCCNQPLGSVQVKAQCKLDFIPVLNDTDPLIIQSVPAISEEAMSLKYSRMDAPQAPALEAKHHAKAISILNGTQDHFLGKVNTAINVPIFGSARLRRMPI